jgi:phosphoenolpyruvate synthase/pyruvate phosphate dikinase
MSQNSHYIFDLSQVHLEDEELVGKKALELGEIKHLGVPIPDGFVITTAFFREFLDTTGISKEIRETWQSYHPALEQSIDKILHPVREKIMHTHIPHDLTLMLHQFYKKLAGRFSEANVNIFSSDKTTKSIHFLNVKGDANVVLKVKKIWALYLDSPVAIVIIKNLKSGVSGKISTENPSNSERLTKKQMDELKKYCVLIQKHLYFPKEIEYIVNKEKIFITKINPFTGVVDKPSAGLVKKSNAKIFVKGTTISPGIVTGHVRNLHGKSINFEVRRGEIVILPNYIPSVFKNIKNAKAIVIDEPLPRYINIIMLKKSIRHIPMIVGAKNASKLFHNRNIITVNGTTGEIHSGGLI